MTTVPPAERSASPAQHGRERDLTTGSVAGHVRALAIPSALSLLFITVYNVTDTLFAGQVSTEAQAGLGLGSQLFFLVTALGVGFRIGASAVVGQLLGAGDHEGAARAATQVLSASIVVTVGVMVAGYFGFDPLVDWIAGGQAYGEAAKQYVDILLLASPGFVVAYALSGVQAAMGDAETLARAQFASSMLNVGLNPLLVFGVPGVLDGMGLAGIAWATLLCQTGVLVYILRTSLRSSVFRAFEMGHLRPDLPMLGELSQQVVPGTARLLVIVVGGVLAQIFLEPFGEDAVAAYNVGLRLEQLLLLARVEGSLSFDDGVQCDAEKVARLAIHDANHGDDERIELILPSQLSTAPVEMPAALAVAALRNLLDNALRHTHVGARVELSLETFDGHAHFRVRDYGPGIPEPDLDKLTQRFWRNGKSPGAGLGLAIVQAIVQRCACSLKFDSRSDGLRVELSMPLRRTTGAGAA